MATPYEIRSLQRAINSFNDRYHLGQAHIAVDSVYGPRTAEESRWMQWLLGMSPTQVGKWKIGQVTNFLLHPSVYWAGPPPRTAQYKAHRARLIAVRRPSPGGHNLSTHDGLTVATWIVPRLEHTGVGYGIPGDQMCCWRGPPGSGAQAALYKRWLAGLERGPVGVPGYSMHEYCDCGWCQNRMREVFGTHPPAKGGAVDVTDPYALEYAGDMRAAGSSDPPHCSNAAYQDQTGRY